MICILLKGMQENRKKSIFQLNKIGNDRNRDLKCTYISYKYNGNTNDITGLPSSLRG
jgi:hypothetical protein